MAININGKYSEALIYSDNVEQDTLSQIYKITCHPATIKADIRIMPDVHLGAGICIGFTAKLTDKVVPNWIGVDIGCGVITYNLGKIDIDYQSLDNFIRNNIPSGRKVRNKRYKNLDDVVYMIREKDHTFSPYKEFMHTFEDLVKKLEEDFHRTVNSLGTLGGGNHFIEIDRDQSGNNWLTIHSGSRHFGLKVAKYHQNKAKKFIESKRKNYGKLIASERRKKGEQNVDTELIKRYETERKEYIGIPSDSAFLPLQEGGDLYLKDMKTAQEYAKINRRVMAKHIIEDYLGLNMKDLEEIESVHNYINFKDNIIRKGAISAYKNEKVIIPLNMRDGLIVGSGKSNKDWNYSAPHGAGRVYSRSKARKTLSLEEFRKEMDGIWTSSISHSTIDESPMAYKDAGEIITHLKQTVDIETIMVPVYNFKAPD